MTTNPTIATARIPSPTPVRPARRWASYVLYATPVLFFLGFAPVFLHDPVASQWHFVYVLAAQDMLVGEPIHDPDPNLAYAYPPAMAMFAAPLANFSPPVSLALWYVVNVAAACIVFTSAWRLAGGPPFSALDRRWLVVLGVATVLGSRYFVTPLENRQFDMVIAATLLAGCCALWRGSDYRAAALLGAGAAMKLTPLLFAPYLAWRRKYASAALLAAIAIGLNVLPDVLWPQQNGNSYLADFGRVFLAPVAEVAPGQWHSDILLNQSLAGFVGRLTAGVDPAVPWPKLLTYGLALALVAATAYQIGRGGLHTVSKYDRGPLPLVATRAGVEAAAVLCLMLLLSPMSSKAHFVVMLLPVFLLTRLAVERRGLWAAVILPALFVCGPLTAKGLIGKPLGDLTLFWGAPMWFVVLSLVALWSALTVADRPRLVQFAPSNRYKSRRHVTGRRNAA